MNRLLFLVLSISILSCTSEQDVAMNMGLSGPNFENSTDTTDSVKDYGVVIAPDLGPAPPDSVAHIDSVETHVQQEDPGACKVAGPYPLSEWPIGKPSNHEMDPVKLQLAADYAGENESHCMVVIRHGHIVGEWYWGDTTESTKVKSWSVGKSYASTVTGLAIDRGAIESVHDAVGLYLPEWEGTPRGEITIHEILAMASGLKFDLMADNLGMVLSSDMTQKALDNPLVKEPGTVWEYNNHTVQIMEPVLFNATGMYADEYIDQHLWQPLGMDAEWAADKSGHPAMYMNVKASCRDHAKFAYLFLKRGCWDGQQIISEEWVETATSPSTPMNQGYGYYWWLNGGHPTLDSVDFKPKAHDLHPFAPDDAFCGVGLGSQFVEVIPSLDMVVVRMGPAPQDNPTFKGKPLKLLEALIEDGKQIVHNGVLKRVIEAVLPMQPGS
jgi:CubicO group peptidase (beta-lactamase class C family)